MNAVTEAMQNHKALLIANYTELLNQWNAAMNAGDYAKGGELMIAINSYKAELGI
jgi:hypothetical protein